MVLITHNKKFKKFKLFTRKLYKTVLLLTKEMLLLRYKIKFLKYFLTFQQKFKQIHISFNANC